MISLRFPSLRRPPITLSLRTRVGARGHREVGARGWANQVRGPPWKSGAPGVVVSSIEAFASSSAAIRSVVATSFRFAIGNKRRSGSSSGYLFADDFRALETTCDLGSYCLRARSSHSRRYRVPLTPKASPPTRIDGSPANCRPILQLDRRLGHSVELDVREGAQEATKRPNRTPIGHHRDIGSTCRKAALGRRRRPRPAATRGCRSRTRRLPSRTL